MNIKCLCTTGLILLAIAAVISACGRGHGFMSTSLAGTTPQAMQPGESLADIQAQLDALQLPEGADAQAFTELKSALIESLAARGVDKFVSTPPSGSGNRVTDLMVTDNGGGTYGLTWHYRNLGDYDQNGAVGVSDITPIAMLFNQVVPAESPNSLLAVVNGSHSGRVGIADITPIAMNYGVDCEEYAVEAAEAVGGPWDELQRQTFHSGIGPGRLTFSALYEALGYLYLRVVPYDANGVAGDPSDPKGLPGSPPGITSVTPDAGLEGSSVQFEAVVAGDGEFTYAWDFGGGATPDTSAEESPTVTLGTFGEYSCSLTVSSIFGSDTFDFLLTIVGPPNIISVSPLSGEQLSVVQFTAQVSGEIDSYAWDFGGCGLPNTSTEISPNVILSDTVGLYNAKLTVYNEYTNVEYPFTFEVTPVVADHRGDWWTVLHDNHRSGQTDAAVGPGYPRVKWSHPLVGYASAPVLDSDGNLYVADRQGLLTKLGPDGSEKWVFDDPLSGFSDPIINKAGIIYWGADHYIYGLRPDGTVFAQDGDWNYYGLAIADNGYMYATERCYLYAIKPDTTLDWTARCGDDTIVEPPAIGDDGTLYIVDRDGGRLYAVGSDGSNKWDYPAAGRVRGPASVDGDGTVYFTSEDGNVYAVNADGSEKWTHTMSMGYPYSSVTIAPNGKLFVYCTYGLYALNPADGSEAWMWPQTGSYEQYRISPGPVIDSAGNVYIIARYGTVASLTQDGAKRWEFGLPNGKIAHQPMSIGADGTLYVSTDTIFYALETDPAPPVINPPVINGVTPTSGTQGQHVFFNADVSGTGPFSYWWEFNGSCSTATSSVASPNVYLGSPGDYTIDLWVENAIGADKYSFVLTIGEDTRWQTPVIIATPVGSLDEGVLEYIAGTPTVVWFNSDYHPYFTKALEAAGDTWSTPIAMQSIWGDNYRQYSLCEIGGTPAIAMYYPYGWVPLYSRSTLADGSAWSAAQQVAADGSNPSLTTAGGLPVVTYRVSTALYARTASDISGSSWSAATTLDGQTADGFYIQSAELVGANWAMAYQGYNGLEVRLRYIHMQNDDGTDWTAPADMGFGYSNMKSLSLAEVNGKPAVAYYNDNYTDRGIHYVQANNAEGSSWGAPITLVDSTHFGSTEGVTVRLLYLHGHPIAFFNGGRFVEALDADGATWGEIQNTPTTPGALLDAIVISDKAYILYCAGSTLCLLREK